MRTVLVTLTMCLFVPPAQAKYSGGTGEPNDPYQIATAADLIALGNEPNDYDMCFVLTADIDLDPNLPGRKVFERAVIAPDTNDVAEWFEGPSFTGFFDGAGHTISHLTIAGGSYLGLFGQVVGYWRPPLGTAVKNLAVVGVRITGTGDYVGGLVGHNYGATVTQCYSSGVVSGSSWVGGLVGMETMSSRRTIMDCYSTAAVSATTAYSGGLVGYNNGRIIRCYSTGPVSAPVGAGGLAGGVIDGRVTDCFWDIETSGQATSFGGMGKTTQEMQAASTFAPWGACVSVWTIDDGRDYPRLACENAPGQIIAGPAYAGGAGTDEDPYLIATAEHLITLGASTCQNDKHFKLVADIDLSGRMWTGAVIPSFSGVFDGNGHILSGLTITGGGYLGLFGQLAADADVRDLGVIDVNVVGADNYVGALAGRNEGGMVTHCFSTGLITGTGYVGGLMGSNGGDVRWCYSDCAVGGDQRVGGLAGYNSGDMTRCYSAGPVSGNTLVGGLIGEGSPAGALHCVWDVQTSAQSGSAGGVGLTTAEMMDPNMLGLNGFADDPDWVLDAGQGYPRLAWQGMAGVTIPEPTVDWLEGEGTAEEPYRIDVADQLILLGKASILWDKHFVLGADIDLAPNLPEGAVFGQAVVPAFSGVFDGDGHAISNLTIQGGSYLGLFGWVTDPNSEIRNLSLIDPNVNGESRLGALAGWMESGTLSNCRVVDANVVGTGQVGGLTASHQSGTISECSVLGGHVSGNSTAGGLVGSGDRIIRCSVRQVEVVSTAVFLGSAGGLAGSAKEIIDCHVTGGLVRGLSDVGGLVARMTGGTISGCCTSTRVERTAKGFSLGLNMGGLVGDNAGTIEDSYSTSSVMQTDPNGLLLLMPSGLGGLVGCNWGPIRRSYSTGAVVTSTSVDAFGFGSALDVGGLAGYGSGDAIESSFWDMETSGQTESAGGTGLTTVEMQIAKTFLDAGWDFVGETANGAEDIWWILEGQDYPRLWWEGSPEPTRQLEFEEVFSYDLGEFLCENHLAIADFDRDGLTDVVLLATNTTSDTEPPWYYASKTILLHNKGNWQFSDSILSQYPGDSYGYWAQAADLNNDQWSDLVIREKGGTHVFLNNRAGQLEEVWVGGPGYCSLDLADVDGDTFADMLSGTTTETGGMVEVFRNNGLGTSFDKTWESRQYGRRGGTIRSIFGANLNGDASTDIVAIEIYSGLLLTFLGDGTGTSFTQKTNLHLGDRTFSLAVGNVNGDHLTDLAVDVVLARGGRVFASGRVHVFVSQGDGSLVERWVGPELHNGAFNLALADFDLDGYDDLFVGTFGDGTLRIYKNRSGAVFEPVWDRHVTGEGYTGTVADLDGDGRPDLVVGEENTIRILHNQSGGGDVGAFVVPDSVGHVIPCY